MVQGVVEEIQCGPHLQIIHLEPLPLLVWADSLCKPDDVHVASFRDTSQAKPDLCRTLVCYEVREVKERRRRGE